MRCLIPLGLNYTEQEILMQSNTAGIHGHIHVLVLAIEMSTNA